MNESLVRPSLVTTGGPRLLVPALAFAALTVAGGIVGAGGTRPDSTAADVLAYAQAHPTALALLATLVMGSAVPLVVWVVTAGHRIRAYGLDVPGLGMAVAGGLLAAASITVSGVLTWTSAQTASLGDAALARALTSGAFAAGAAGFVVPLGLAVLGTAVPVLLGRLVPRPLAWAGVVVGGLALLTALTPLLPVLYPLLPVGRFGGLLWFVALSSVRLPALPRRAAG